MELRINDYQVTPEITFNFEELKNEISDRVSYYKDLVYTDDQIKEAKSDRARLRKIVDAIDAERKKVKADVLAPYDALEKKLNEIKALLQEPITMIDNQVKAYEDLQKQQKEEQIRQMWEEKGNLFDIMIIWNTKWLNATYSMKKISDEMDEASIKYSAGIETLKGLDEYSFEAIEVFNSTLDLGTAMVRANELKAQAQRKAEYEAGRQQNETPKAQQLTWPEETERTWIKFEAYMTVQEALCLRDFFNGNNIQFRKGE